MKLVVLGGGESGVGAALLGKKEGYEVFLSDKGQLAAHYRQVLVERGIEFEEGHHTEARIFAADVVVKSPGIPDALPMIVRLREQGTEVISEIEFAGRYSSARYICITGSNGKTTTTLLTHHILPKQEYYRSIRPGCCRYNATGHFHVDCTAGNNRIFSPDRILKDITYSCIHNHSSHLSLAQRTCLCHLRL